MHSSPVSTSLLKRKHLMSRGEASRASADAEVNFCSHSLFHGVNELTVTYTTQATFPSPKKSDRGVLGLTITVNVSNCMRTNLTRESHITIILPNPPQ